MRRSRARVALLTSVLLLLTLFAGALPVAAQELPPDTSTIREQKIERVIRIAKRQIGDPWVWGRTGPSAFDCIGLVYYSFKQAHALRLMGGQYRTIGALRTWAARDHRADRRNPRRGDLIIWGANKHIGIYLGNRRAISALVSGVRIHKVNELYDPFTIYLHLPRAW